MVAGMQADTLVSMTCDEPPDDYRDLLIVVVTAAATTIVTGLASWAIDELRDRYGSAKKNENPSSE